MKKTTQEAAQKLNGVSIVIADDEGPLREVLREEFENQGAKVREASNGPEAWELLKQEPAKVLITDVRMPGGNGVDLLKRLKEFGSAAPLTFLISGFSDISAEATIAEGGQALIAKPFDIDSLVERIRVGLLAMDQLANEKVFADIQAGLAQAQTEAGGKTTWPPSTDPAAEDFPFSAKPNPEFTLERLGGQLISAQFLDYFDSTIFFSIPKASSGEKPLDSSYRLRIRGNDDGETVELLLQATLQEADRLLPDVDVLTLSLLAVDEEKMAVIIGLVQKRQTSLLKLLESARSLPSS